MLFTALILNLTHPGATTAARELGALDEVGTYLTTPESPGPERVTQAPSGGASSAVIMGGDGAQRLAAGALADIGMPLGVLVTGIACVHSRNLGPSRGSASVALAMTSVPCSMSLGQASFDGGSPEPLLAATGTRWDAETLLGVRNNLKRRLGWVAYVRAGLGTMGRHRLPLRISGQPTEAWTVLAGNVGRVPMASLFPGACPGDGRLHVMHLRVDGQRNWWPVLLVGMIYSHRDIGKLLHWETAHVFIGSDILRATRLGDDPRTAVYLLEVWADPRTLRIRCPGERQLVPFRQYAPGGKGFGLRVIPLSVTVRDVRRQFSQTGDKPSALPQNRELPGDDGSRRGGAQHVITDPYRNRPRLLEMSQLIRTYAPLRVYDQQDLPSIGEIHAGQGFLHRPAQGQGKLRRSDPFRRLASIRD